MKIIHITEEAYKRLFKEIEEVPFLTFYDDVVKFVKGILNDPIGTKPSKLLVSYGLDNGELRKKLYDYNVITKDEKIDEPFDEVTKEKVSKYYVSYKVHKDNFKDKIRKLYNDTMKLNENKQKRYGKRNDSTN